MPSSSQVRLFLDSAELAAWREWLGSGVFYGTTTNPTLLRRAGVACDHYSLRALAEDAFELGAREIHLQAWGETAEAFRHCGLLLAALDPARICVKLPLTRAGTEAARQLIREGYRVTFTACYAVSQILIAAAVGAEYVAPYLGRINDAGRDGFSEIVGMQQALVQLNAATRLLVASLREPTEPGRLAAAGVQTFTLSPTLAAAIFDNAETLAAARQFELDAQGEAAH